MLYAGSFLRGPHLHELTSCSFGEIGLSVSATILTCRGSEERSAVCSSVVHVLSKMTRWIRASAAVSLPSTTWSRLRPLSAAKAASQTLSSQPAAVLISTSARVMGPAIWAAVNAWPAMGEQIAVTRQVPSLCKPSKASQHTSITIGSLLSCAQNGMILAENHIHVSLHREPSSK